MRFQKRDGEILQAIYDNDGVLARRHLKILFWPDKSWRAMGRRLSKLLDAGYISRPSREQYKIHPIPEPICWLSWRGAFYIAGKRGVEIEQPKSYSEYKLREFQKELRKHGIRWVREPRWSLLRHDLAVADFRLSMEKAVGELRSCSLRKWQTESEFRSNMEIVTYTVRESDGNLKKMKKGVCPDAYFEVVDEALSAKGESHWFRYLLELDMSTHDNPSFGREKVIPGVAYIKSPQYKRRFGYNNGRWLVVTNGGDIRLRNLMRQTREKVGDYAKLFYFSTLKQLETSNVLTSPIWYQVDRDERGSLFGGGESNLYCSTDKVLV